MELYPPQDYRGQASYRLPKAIYHGLFHLRPPGATPWEYDACRVWIAPEMFDFGLIKLTPFRMKNQRVVNAVILTDWGKRVANLLPMQKVKKSTCPPILPIRDLLAASKPEIISALAGTTPLPRSAGGLFFRAVGVLADDPMGGINLIRTSALRDALQELHVKQDGPVLVDTFLTGEQMVFLRQAYSGIAVNRVELDGRSIKPLGPGYMGLVKLDSGGVYRVPPKMRPFAALAMVNCRDTDELFAALPEIDKVWIASGLQSDTTKMHTYLLHKMGWLYKRGRSWSLTKLAKDQLEGWCVRLRGSPVELLLPADLPSDPDDFGVLDLPDGPDSHDACDGPDSVRLDPFDMLDMTPSFAKAPPPVIVGDRVVDPFDIW